MRPHPIFALSVLATALLVVLVLALTHRGSAGRSSSATTPSATSATAPFDGAALPTAAPLREFTLTDQTGRRVSLADYRGRVTVLAFVYSTCGDTCVVMAQQIRGALNELPHPVPVLLVSADPAADTPAHVRSFLEQVSLTGRVRYLSGSAATLRPIWRAYGVVPARSGRTAFDRFASVLLLEASGRERVIFQLEQLTPEALAHDIGKLADG